MRHILVPTDFSETAQAAFKYAVELCRDLRGKITLLHVSHTERVNETLMGLDAVGYLSSTLDSPSTTSEYSPSFDTSALKNIAHRKLDECIALARCNGVSIEAAFEEGRPSVKIVEYAREHEVDMIVMGTHSRGPVAHFFLGSVAENVVRSADCPVLTVRGKSKVQD